jgi:hypothetical protein
MLAIDFHTWCKNSRKIMAPLSVICTLILFKPSHAKQAFSSATAKRKFGSSKT